MGGIGLFGNSKKSNIIKKILNKGETHLQMETVREKNILYYCSKFAKYQPNTTIIFATDKSIFSINNEAIKNILGFEPNHLRELKTILPPDTYTSLALTMEQALEGKIEKHLINFTFQEEKYDLLLTFIPIEQENNEVEGVYLIIENVSEKLSTIGSLRDLFDGLNTGVWMKNSINGDFSFISNNIASIFEVSLEKVNKRTFTTFIHPEDREVTQIIESQLSQRNKAQAVYRIVSGNGKVKWLSEQISIKYNNNGEVEQLLGIIHDITREKQLEEKLIFIEKYDELTGLPNQKSLYELLDYYCENRKPFALLYLDIDRFNMINDSLGYEIGDEVLKIVANRLKDILPSNGHISRISSNDFVVTQSAFHHKDQVIQLAEKIIHEVERPIIVEDYEIYVSMSIGISFFPEEGEEKLSLIENAHTALYLAKREGKGNYQLFTYSKDISSYKKYVLDRDMRKAILNEEFELYFQPKVEPIRGQIYGAEVLIRWNHNEWGAISPSEFIPIAEENQTINLITDWVIKRVLSLLKEWKEQGFLLRTLSVNVPPIRFMRNRLVELVKEQLQINDIPAKFLELEVTESTLLRSDKIVLSKIEELKKLGIKIAIDDFGIGYASFDLLRKFHPDTLKIDQVFVQNIHHENEMDRGIISSILYLAKTLEMKVVAEGVEELHQIEFLKQQECDFIQGYIFSPPVSQSEYERLMKIGYLKPKNKSNYRQSGIEKRKFFRFKFPNFVLAKMTISEVNNQKVDVGATPILLDNIGLEGIKYLSNLKLPINSNMKFKFEFTLMGQPFEIEGFLKWIEEEFGGIYSYGVQFQSNKLIEDKLAPIINRMSALNKKNERIPDTEFINKEAHLYLRESN